MLNFNLFLWFFSLNFSRKKSNKPEHIGNFDQRVKFERNQSDIFKYIRYQRRTTDGPWTNSNYDIMSWHSQEGLIDGLDLRLPFIWRFSKVLQTGNVLMRQSSIQYFRTDDPCSNDSLVSWLTCCHLKHNWLPFYRALVVVQRTKNFLIIRDEESLIKIQLLFLILSGILSDLDETDKTQWNLRSSKM